METTYFNFRISDMIDENIEEREEVINAGI